jgi:RNA polymerase sigma factor FliA
MQGEFTGSPDIEDAVDAARQATRRCRGTSSSEKASAALVMTMTDSTERNLWTRFRLHNDISARDALLEAYAPWALGLASGLFRQFRYYMVDREDYLQNANIGLLEAMSRYDPEKGIPFRAYAKPRVCGAVLNGLRVLRNRHVESAADNAMREICEYLPDSGGCAPFEEAVDLIANVCAGFLLGSAYQIPIDRKDGFIYTKNRELEARVLSAVEMLPDRLRAMIIEHYYHHVPFHEIAAHCGLTKSRISQLHRDALRRIRAGLSEDSIDHF